jgi:hypothetical protein
MRIPLEDADVVRHEFEVILPAIGPKVESTILRAAFDVPRIMSLNDLQPYLAKAMAVTFDSLSKSLLQIVASQREATSTPMERPDVLAHVAAENADSEGTDQDDEVHRSAQVPDTVGDER